MTITRRELLVTAAAVALAGKARAQSGVERNARLQDIVLWYDKPAARWADALPIGNGGLGAMVFGGGADGAPAKEFCRSTKTHFGRANHKTGIIGLQASIFRRFGRL
jgi:hypothetical protein